MPKPLKRDPFLQALSREHHHGLLLSWKIREGFKKDIDIQRIKDYVDWFYANHLVPHFSFEEEFIFPILEKDHPLIKRAIKDHKRLRRLFEAKEKPEKTISLIEEELIQHIRFEERVLFQEIQKRASPTEIELIESAHEVQSIENWHDQFWLKNDLSA